MSKDAKKSFVLYYDYRQHLELLSDEERGQLLMALLNYAENGIEPELKGAAMMAFSFIRAQMDRDAAKYAATVQKRREAGKQGGRPPKANESTEKQTKAKKANGFSEKQTKAKKANGFSEKQTKAKKPDNDNVNDNDTDNVNDNDIYITPHTPQGADAQDRRFAEFWAEYPKKVGKKAALASWKKVKPDAKLHERIMQAVAIAKKSEQWNREGGRFVPNPSTWLNQGRWDDELTPAGTNQERKWQTHGEHSGHDERQERHEGTGNKTTLSGFRMADD